MSSVADFFGTEVGEDEMFHDADIDFFGDEDDNANELECGDEDMSETVTIDEVDNAMEQYAARTTKVPASTTSIVRPLGPTIETDPPSVWYVFGKDAMVVQFIEYNNPDRRWETAVLSVVYSGTGHAVTCTGNNKYVMKEKARMVTRDGDAQILTVHLKIKELSKTHQKSTFSLCLLTPDYPPVVTTPFLVKSKMTQSKLKKKSIKGVSLEFRKVAATVFSTLEWRICSDTEPITYACPICRSPRTEGHKVDCEMTTLWEELTRTE